MSDKKTQLIGEIPSGGTFLAVKVESGGYLSVIDSSLNSKITTIDSVLDNVLTALNSLIALDLKSKTRITKTIDFTSDQTAVTIWTPTLSYFIITDLFISASDNLLITVFDNSDSTTNRICKFDLVAGGGVVINFKKPFKSAVAGNVLKFTTVSTSGSSGSITVNGYEEN